MSQGNHTVNQTSATDRQMAVLNENAMEFARKVSEFILFCKDLMDINEARLHEATLNLHTHACP